MDGLDCLVTKTWHYQANVDRAEHTGDLAVTFVGTI